MDQFLTNLTDLRKKCEESAEFCERMAQMYLSMAKGFQLMASSIKLVEENPFPAFNPVAFYDVLKRWGEYFNNLAGQQAQAKEKTDPFFAGLDRLWF